MHRQESLPAPETEIPVNGWILSGTDLPFFNQYLKRFIDEPRLLADLRGNIEPVKTIEDNGEELEMLYLKLRKHWKNSFHRKARQERKERQKSILAQGRGGAEKGPIFVEL